MAPESVLRKKVTSGYQALISENMQNMAFEAVVMRHPDLFTPDAMEMSKQRMKEWERLGPAEMV